MKLRLRRKYSKRLVKCIKQPLEVPASLNECWSMDFMSDALTDGRNARVFNVIDDCSREALVINAGLSYQVIAVIETMEQSKE